MKVADRILVIADLLLGALYADQSLTGEEDRAVRRLLADLLLVKPEALPAHVEAHIRTFDIVDFDLEESAAEFLEDPPMKRRRLLELVARMVHSDGELDLREDDYMHDLADCLGMEPDEYQDLVLDYDIERLRESFDNLRAVRLPPPVPVVAQAKGEGDGSDAG